MSAVSASSTRREEDAAGPGGRPLDKVRALQRTLYRCAKQEPARRFHALYGHVHRMDVLRRAWAGVCANRGAPGVDGMTVDAVETSGVDAFLQDLSQRLRTHTYRPAVLRRVQIPNLGRPGEFWPLSIPTVADRVVMTAAKLVLEPVFEAQFTEANYGSGRSGPRSTHAKLCVSPRTSGGSGCSRPISATASARSTMRR